MKKRFFALVLAMALCFGLAAPAMAAGTGVTVTGPVYLNSTYMLHLNFSDGRARVANSKKFCSLQSIISPQGAEIQ